jgi:hypothetical protein
MGAIRQGRFFDGTTANLARNMAFLTASNVVIDSYRQAILRYNILGSAKKIGKSEKSQKLNHIQESLARTLSGCTAVFAAVFFDNVKTRAQVNGRAKEHSNVVAEAYNDLKKSGLRTNARAAVPYSFAEALGLLGFYTGTYMARTIQEKCTPHEVISYKP